MYHFIILPFIHFFLASGFSSTCIVSNSKLWLHVTLVWTSCLYIQWSWKVCCLSFNYFVLKQLVFIYHCFSLISRQVDELLWLLKRAELKDQLYYTILRIDILIFMFSRFVFFIDQLFHSFRSSRISELILYWNYICNEESMAIKYFESLKECEIGTVYHLNFRSTFCIIGILLTLL